MKQVLNVGGNSKQILLPQQFSDFEQVLLDIDPRNSPNIVCDARELVTLNGSQFDAIYCSHNLEHYYRHDVQKVLTGFLHVMKPDGFVYIVVPDMQEVMRITVENNLDIEDTLYESPAGPIMVLDVLYGFGIEIERSGQHFYGHKTGFTRKSLEMALYRAGFLRTYMTAANLEIIALGFRGSPDPSTRALFNLPSS